MAILAVDFGGTRIRAGWFDEDLRLLARAETLTLAHEPQENVLDRLLQTARQVVPVGSAVRSIGVSAPSPQASSGVISHATVLPGWVDVPLAQIITDAFEGAPVFMENDGNMATIAEYALGAAKGKNPAIYLTISTSIGGGVMIDGELFVGQYGLAFEPGHIKCLHPDGGIYSIEYFASGTGLARIARQRLGETSEASALRAMDGITGKVVGEAAQAGDPLALSVVAEAGLWMGLGLVNVLHMFSPEVVVLGGSVMQLGELLLGPARQVVRSYVVNPRFYHDDLFRISTLGDDVCLIGAAAYARSRQ